MPTRPGHDATAPVPAASVAPLDISELTDLGERRLGDRLDVPPGAPRQPKGRFRPPAAAVVVGALVLIAVAVAGADLPGSGETSIASPSAGTSGSPADAPTPTAADPCPPEGLTDPTVALGRKGGPWTTRDVAPERWVSPELAGFHAPVDAYVDASAGDYMVLRVTPAGCVADIRVDVQATGIVGGDGLGVLTRPTGDGRGWGLFAPPLGDWTVRIAMRLHGGSAAGDEWAIYFLRLRVDGAPFVEPYPSGDPGQNDPGTIVSPLRPCSTRDRTLTAPPELTLMSEPGDAIPAVIGAFEWNDGRGVDPDLATLPAHAVSLTGSPFIRITGDSCAAAWDISVGAVPGAGEAFLGSFQLDLMDQNPTLDPRIASQNQFDLWSMPLGPVLIRANLQFPGGDRLTAWWRLDVDLPDVPAVSARPRSGATAVSMTPGCGLEWQVQGTTDGGGIQAYEPCWGLLGEGWGVPTGIGALSVRADDLLHVESGGVAIRYWSIAYDEPLRVPGSEIQLAGGSFEAAVTAVDLPVPPPGDWVVRVWLSVASPSGDIGAPFYLLLTVLP